MTLKKIDIAPVVLKPETKSDSASKKIDLSNDYGTPNFLLFNYVPFLPDDKKQDLDFMMKHLSSWNAWELGQAEVQLDEHVEKGNLPSDDSIASRLIRNNYRSKALEVFRASSEAWLVAADSDNVDRVVETTPDKALGAILHLMRSFAVEKDLPKPIPVFLNALSGYIDLAKENKFFLTHVIFKYDQSSQKLVPVVMDTTCTIKTQDAKNKSKDSLKIDLSFVINSYKVDMALWGRIRPEGEEAIQLGEPIRAQMAVDFYIEK